MPEPPLPAGPYAGLLHKSLPPGVVPTLREKFAVDENGPEPTDDTETDPVWKHAEGPLGGLRSLVVIE